MVFNADEYVEALFPGNWANLMFLNVDHQNPCWLNVKEYALFSGNWAKPQANQWGAEADLKED